MQHEVAKVFGGRASVVVCKWMVLWAAAAEKFCLAKIRPELTSGVSGWRQLYPAPEGFVTWPVRFDVASNELCVRSK